MGRGQALALVACAALSGAAIASVVRGASGGLLAAGAAVGLVVGGWICLRQGVTLPGDRLEAAALVVPAAAFLIPLLTMPVAPGADMAMHAALGRALMEGSDALSPAWGSVSATLYPKGMSALIALTAPVLGIAKASLLAAGVSYLVVVAGLAAFLHEALRLPRPFALAALAVLASKSPQSFFGWGGNPTAMAFGLALFAMALLARAWRGEPSPISSAIGASALLLGAAATHPTGALAGLCAAAALPIMLGRPTKAGLGACLAALAVFGAGLAALWLGGPTLSAAEVAWISDYQRDVEAVLHGPRALFAITVWPAMVERLGPGWTIAAGAASLGLLAAGQWRRVAGALAAIVAIGALLALGPLIPKAGVLFYPVRFAPLLLVATVPLVGWALEALAHRSSRLAAAVVLGLAAMAVVVNVRTYQRATPMATRNDLQAIACAAQVVPKTAVIQGAYGDATQWIPALTGLAVTAAHPHISLNDEIRAQPSLAPSHLFLGERLVYGSAIVPKTLVDKPLCSSGKAFLYINVP